jgi:phosphoserine phosphatase RsbU/P
MAIELNNLRESNTFLNLLMDNITSAVFLVDKDMRVQQFNVSFTKLLSKSERELVNQLCGNALGCVFAVEENQSCGNTSNCEACILRSTIIRGILDKVPAHKASLHREFYFGGAKIDKYFLFSTIYLSYHNEEMILVIVDDVTEIESHRLQLIEKQRLLDEDLKAAAEIQRSLLPASFPPIDNCRFAARFIPCERIGGDIYNVFELDEDRVVIYLIDVSGHGVPAAMVTVSVSQMLHPTTGYFCDSHGVQLSSCNTGLACPKEVLEALDSNYPIERFDKHFTMSYLVLNHRDSTIISCNAGHPPPVLLHANGQIELLEQGGGIVGLDGVIPFEEETKSLVQGDKLILYTDGITEYLNNGGEFYGEERLYNMLSNLAKSSAQELVDSLVDSVLEFGDKWPPEDDITLVALEVLAR